MADSGIDNFLISAGLYYTDTMSVALPRDQVWLKAWKLMTETRKGFFGTEVSAHNFYLDKQSDNQIVLKRRFGGNRNRQNVIVTIECTSHNAVSSQLLITARVEYASLAIFLAMLSPIFIFAIMGSEMPAIGYLGISALVVVITLINFAVYRSNTRKALREIVELLGK